MNTLRDFVVEFVRETPASRKELLTMLETINNGLNGVYAPPKQVVTTDNNVIQRDTEVKHRKKWGGNASRSRWNIAVGKLSEKLAAQRGITRKESIKLARRLMKGKKVNRKGKIINGRLINPVSSEKKRLMLQKRNMRAKEIAALNGITYKEAMTLASRETKPKEVELQQAVTQ